MTLENLEKERKRKDWKGFPSSYSAQWPSCFAGQLPSSRVLASGPARLPVEVAGAPSPSLSCWWPGPARGISSRNRMPLPLYMQSWAVSLSFYNPSVKTHAVLRSRPRGTLKRCCHARLRRIRRRAAAVSGCRASCCPREVSHLVLRTKPDIHYMWNKEVKSHI
jgi:hypothetical protein